MFDEKELIDLLSRIIEISKEVVTVANKAAEACTSKLPKQVQNVTVPCTSLVYIQCIILYMLWHDSDHIKKIPMSRTGI